MRIGLTFDCDSTNKESAQELSSVCCALQATGHDLVHVGTPSELIDKLAAGQRFDLVFNLYRGCSGAKSTTHVAAILDAMCIPTIFASVTSLSLCAHRGYMKSILRERGVPTSDHWMVETLDDLRHVDTKYPVTASSACDYATVRQVADATELSKVCCQLMSQVDQAVIVEPCLTGPTWVVGMLGSGASAMAMLPANLLNQSSASAARRTAQAAWNMLGGADAGCVTLQSNTDGQLMVCCVDAMPCLSDASPLMQAAEAAGLSSSDVIQRIFESACHRAELHGSHKEPPKPHMVGARAESPVAPRK